MMGKIHVLDEITANKIAAGEVVERPAAVVKELVENALDAGAKHINITLNDGGLEFIRVVDDGCGMAPEDVPLSLQRHATSKIKSASDLSTVLSLGFRGEALPSIASVSHFRLVTRRSEDLVGTEIIIQGGKTIRMEEAGSPQGTDVKVEKLFYNTPARLKFMKSAAAETARVTDIVQRIAVAWPHVAFTLTVNGKTKLSTPGTGKMEDAIAQVMGQQNLRQLIPLYWESPLLTLSGFIAKPALNRANRNLQYFYVNGRSVRSPLLADALQTAYHTLLPRHRFPVAVIMLQIEPELVDVNVHPTKREVRFSQERDIYRQILAGVKSTLQKASLLGEMSLSSWPAARETAADLFRSESYFNKNINFQAQLDIAPPKVKPAMPVISTTDKTPTEIKDQPTSFTARDFPFLTPVGQYLATYILAQSEAGDLYLIDQHAAHERILYDMIKKDLSTGKLPVQEILPQTYTLDAVTAATLQQSLRNLAQLGLNFETFGNNTFILRSMPLFIKDSLKQQELVDLLTQANLEQGCVSLFEKTMQMMACKGAIKANQLLDKKEMTALLANLADTADPYTCPHGRPTVMVITAQTVAKNFRRE
ncbi:MAG: DNA mismatch repair endonuclease MutL [Firmicutes bacterium]|nr:DNA mismatch repair endonuclease MutL [Bacillota bacterium]